MCVSAWPCACTAVWARSEAGYMHDALLSYIIYILCACVVWCGFVHVGELRGSTRGWGLLCCQYIYLLYAIRFACGLFSPTHHTHKNGHTRTTICVRTIHMNIACLNLCRGFSRSHSARPTQQLCQLFHALWERRVVMNILYIVHCAQIVLMLFAGGHVLLMIWFLFTRQHTTNCIRAKFVDCGNVFRSSQVLRYLYTSLYTITRHARERDAGLRPSKSASSSDVTLCTMRAHVFLIAQKKPHKKRTLFCCNLSTSELPGRITKSSHSRLRVLLLLHLYRLSAVHASIVGAQNSSSSIASTVARTIQNLAYSLSSAFACIVWSILIRTVYETHAFYVFKNWSIYVCLLSRLFKAVVCFRSRKTRFFLSCKTNRLNNTFV